MDIVKKKDATRPVTLAAAFPELSTATGLLDRLDVVGYNYKEHLYEADHRRFPDRPLLGSENSHRYRDWLAAARNDYIAGQFLWTGIDYLGETYRWPSHGSHAGLLTLAGFDKPTWHLRRSWWSDAPMAHIVTRPHDEAAEKSFWTQPGLAPMGRRNRPGRSALLRQWRRALPDLRRRRDPPHARRGSMATGLP